MRDFAKSYSRFFSLDSLNRYYRLSTGVLIDRLINRGLYPLALEICNYLSIAPANGEVKVLREWALRKVQDKGLSDEEVGKMIIQKLKDTSVVVSFAEIANAALKEGRNGLATQLLDHEVYAKDQVPLLMEMKKPDLSLDKAIESGDPELGRMLQLVASATMLFRLGQA